jgi:NADH:ubiquinone oxidoreductase subunit 4 (subunit M)
MIRLYIRTVHNRLNPTAESRDFTRGELVPVVPLVVVIVALGVYPQLVVERTEAATDAQIVDAAVIAQCGDDATVETFRDGAACFRRAEASR